MALWKDTTTPGSSPAPIPSAAKDPVREVERPAVAPLNSAHDTRRPKERVELKETVISSGLNIEGKIEGAGNVRISGKFKGDVHIEGDLTIDAGAQLNGQVRANLVAIAGELQGNVESARRVELAETAVMTGDVKAGALTVAAGSRMRGQVEFGWDEKHSRGHGEARGTASGT
ncbi:MAG TPA: polymer-forming cytoskeletal protein [Steroidobacteraceae bacterium]|nr:polymer-forming cytoskeletal protein [Steroidobacteraceae bacterium]HNS26518.1 polymer-forming cytoskeletal protein [Steroidobacteraceae bacterium]